MDTDMPLKNPKITTSACPECGKLFEHYRSQPRRYCSLACSSRVNIKRQIPGFVATSYVTACEQCGVQFEVKPAMTRGRFCSSRCYGDWQATNKTGENHPNKGKKFGRNPHLPKPMTLICPECATEFAIKPSQANRRRYCSKACQGIAFSRDRGGDKSVTWLGGRFPYYGPTWHAAKRFVRRRDKVCQDCGKTPEENGKALDVHHVKPFRAFGVDRHEEANDPSNLTALCVKCHLLRDWAENRRIDHQSVPQ